MTMHNRCFLLTRFYVNSLRMSDIKKLLRPGMNRSDFTEEETSRALYASYQLLILGRQGAPGSKLNMADEQHFSQGQGNRNLPAIQNVGNKTLQREEASNAVRTVSSTRILDSAKKQRQTSTDGKHAKVNERRPVDEEGSLASKKIKSKRLSLSYL